MVTLQIPSSVNFVESPSSNDSKQPPSVVPVQSKRKRKREKEKANKQSSFNITPTTTKRSKPNATIVSAVRIEPKPKPQHYGKSKKPIRPEQLNPAISQMNPLLIADYFGQRLRRVNTNASIVELNDSSVPERAFVDTTSYTNPRNLAHLADFLEQFAGLSNKLIPTVSATGSPHTLIITAAALRAADVSREVRRFQGRGCMVAKLFAKHTKLQESIKLCNSLEMGIGVGTPRRILDLIRDGALKTDNVNTIVLDLSATNEKQQGILEIHETAISLFDLLNEPRVKVKLGDEIRILTY